MPVDIAAHAPGEAAFYGHKHWQGSHGHVRRIDNVAVSVWALSSIKRVWVDWHIDTAPSAREDHFLVVGVLVAQLATSAIRGGGSRPAG